MGCGLQIGYPVRLGIKPVVWHRPWRSWRASWDDRPTDEEVQRAMGIDSEEYSKLLQDVAATTLLSLDEPWSEGGSDGEKLSLADMVPDETYDDPASRVTRDAVLEVLAEAIVALPERERLVITPLLL